MSTVAWAWRVPVALAALQVLLHLVLGRGYGIFRDELYYWDCANHLAWGYVDHPPLSVAALAAWKGIFGDSLLSLRVPPALAGGALVLLVARLAARLGGGEFAKALAALVTFATPSYLGITGIYSMNSFELLFWAAGYLILMDLLERNRRRDWILFGVCVGLGLLNKISVAVFAAAAGVVILARTRLRALGGPGPYLALAITAVAFAPHILWQIQNGWPTREFMENAQRYKMTAMSPLEFLGGVAMEMGPTMAPLLALGLAVLVLSGTPRNGRPLGWIVLVAVAVFTVNRSKPYYAVAALCPAIAGVSVWVETVSTDRFRWMRPVAVAYTLVGFVITTPFAIPILPVEKLIAYQNFLGLRASSGENRDTGDLPQFFADRFGWRELAGQVATIVRALPPEERDACLIVADNYGQAGAINYFGRREGIPRAVSQHNSYYLWGPDLKAPKVYVIIGSERGDLEAALTEVQEVARTATPHAMPDETDVPIWVCRGLRFPLEDAWRRGRHYI